MKRLLTGATVITLLVFVIPNSYAASAIGGKCTQVNKVTLISSKVAICTKSGSQSIWRLATKAQKSTYIQQEQKRRITQRKQTVINLSELKSRYSDIGSIATTLNELLIQSKRNLIGAQRTALIELQKQKESENQDRANSMNSLAELNNSISNNQSKISSLLSQINNQQSTVNIAKVNHDSAYTNYVSVKAQSDYLSYSYQSALSENSAMLTAKVLCDFGFGSCGIYRSSEYSKNASIISQYNLASTRTSSAYNVYSSYYSQYSNGLNTLLSLKSQQIQLDSVITTSNAQKSQVAQNISTSDSKLSILQNSISQAMTKFSSLELAEKRIDQDVQRFNEIRDALNLKSADLSVAIDAFLQMADDTFIATLSVNTWNSKYAPVAGFQKEVDKLLFNLKELTTSLDAFMESIR
jgi:chromosome segregation ATPase